MQNVPGHEIEFQSSEMFQILLNHEVNRSRRYGDSLTLILLLVEAEPPDAEARQAAETFMADLLKRQLRETDILHRQANEFQIIMPATSAPGARTACERIRKLIPAEHQLENGASFKLSFFIGMASMPADRSASSAELEQHTALALQHARIHHSLGAVAFSEIK
jgi:hypothetical protein